ncbi:fungal-specific transcription factor domain-domain-containing protein [Tuber borchii]|uniref:Fungal-specific transcription factor domain-domain-containing protein n=1 Tax=Tuber borchii TaxID=42251 RepID=A0A2T6ZIA4_TUBBO|nr:fungal-specific transcription factor domain-domain-containing protein [Tuber borchii]
MNEGAEICVLCNFHSQECTFVQSPQPRKRRLASSNVSSEDQVVIKKRSTEPESPQETAIRGNIPVDDYANLRGPSLLKTTLGLQGHRHSQLIGPTSEYEPCLIDLCPFDQKDEYMLSSAGGSFRRASDEITFLMFPDHPTQNHSEIFDDLDAIERIVAPHGQSLINLYFRIVHPSFPILHKKVFLEKYSRTHREFSPPLLAAVYILALHWWSYDRDLSPQKKPDVAALEKLASKTIADVMHRPKLAAVQAGLLLLQRHSDLKGGSWALTCQLVAVGQELGLHLNCEGWKIPPWERGLRKRLAWGLFMQDKWGALTHGRPSHITRSNWAVPAVTAEDFPENAADEDDEEGSSEVEKGRMLFEQMINLSGIMADVLETFFTLEAQQSLAGRGGINRVLEKAKPIQIRLKEWFSKLPECLRMDATKVRKLSSNGYLHLSYFATEITLHRQILRSLSPPTNTESYIHHICRSAAKTRLISAMDFVNRLKPEHLQSFWYFASKVNFALIGTFGSLLWATSPNTQEAEFYKARLSEYRWTLRVSSRGAEFMEYAVGVLDASAGEVDDDGEMTDGSSTSSRRRLNSSSASPSMKAYQGFPFVDSGPNDPLATNASTPTSTTSSAFDFFMIPNGMPGGRMQGAEAAGVTRGELDFLAATAGWRSRRDGDD